MTSNILSGFCAINSELLFDFNWLADIQWQHVEGFLKILCNRFRSMQDSFNHPYAKQSKAKQSKANKNLWRIRKESLKKKIFENVWRWRNWTSMSNDENTSGFYTTHSLPSLSPFPSSLATLILYNSNPNPSTNLRGK